MCLNPPILFLILNPTYEINVFQIHQTNRLIPTTYSKFLTNCHFVRTTQQTTQAAHIKKTSCATQHTAQAAHIKKPTPC